MDNKFINSGLTEKNLVRVSDLEKRLKIEDLVLCPRNFRNFALNNT